MHLFRIVLMGARIARVDEYDESEWSLCSPCSLLLSLLSWYGEDIAWRCRRWSCFSRGKCKMHPYLMVAALFFFTKTQGTVEIERTPCNQTFHLSWWSGGFRHPHTSAHSLGTAPGNHNGVVPGGIGRSVSAKASSMILMGRIRIVHSRRTCRDREGQVDRRRL